MLRALNASGTLIDADDIVERESEYRCKDCNQIVLFVDSMIRVKHFRHREKCECESEPETPEHVHHKRAVYDELCKMNFGQVFLEHSIEDGIRPDVLLVRDNAPAIAIEVQATNIDLSLFDKKIEFYKTHGYITVYLLVESRSDYEQGKDGYWNKLHTTDFLYSTKKNVYRLKEIEKRLMYFCHYGMSVKAVYIFDHKIHYYDFERKFAKGGDGYCSDTFRTNWGNNIEGTIQDYFEQFRLDKSTNPKVEQAKTEKPKTEQPKIEAPKTEKLNVKKSECSHPSVDYELRSEQMIVRYQILCSVCGKHRGWLPDKKALELGLVLPHKQVVLDNRSSVVKLNNQVDSFIKVASFEFVTDFFVKLFDFFAVFALRCSPF